MNFIYEIGIALFQLLCLCVEVRIPGTTHCYTSIDFIECSSENVKVAFSVGEVDIFYFPFATMYLETNKQTAASSSQFYDFEYRNKVWCS